MEILINVVISVVILAWLLINQLRVKPLTTSHKLWIILAAIGVARAYGFLADHPLTVSDVLLTLVSIAIGAGIALYRAHTVRLWSDNGTAMRQGSWLTGVLWIVGIAQHLLVDLFVAEGLGVATLTFYLALMLAVQRFAINNRAVKMGLIKPGEVITSRSSRPARAR
ncbi:hypothetical protein D9V34_01830 [Mycetocola lacteus]|uniref:DUF1453 family protein n=1 Tax=Mycetocola lacteus TaxID=76637 RepID=A0A3L7AW58_9MICO|nr:hypothetical protein [Mycetocola lacteus]RLP84759.1 hypothetical protein D9V34_01830 [Mycetocola lacteus]